MRFKYFRGDVGIGTLIVFIAMVLVAAIAATVLLNVSGMLQQRASATGKQATSQVSSNIQVMGVYGYQASASANNLIRLLVTIKAASGSQKIDLRNVMIRVSNGTADGVLYANTSTTNPSGGTSTTFGMVERVDPNGLFDAPSSSFVIDQSSLLDLNISLQSMNINVTPRTTLSFSIVPETGAPVNFELITPPTFVGTSIQLYP